MLYDLLQLIGGVILSVGWVPQIAGMVKAKSAAGLNIKTIVSLLLGISLMEVYAIHLVVRGAGMAFLVTNSLSLVLLSVILVLYLRFKA